MRNPWTAALAILLAAACAVEPGIEGEPPAEFEEPPEAGGQTGEEFPIPCLMHLQDLEWDDSWPGFSAAEVHQERARNPAGLAWADGGETIASLTLEPKPGTAVYIDNEVNPDFTEYVPVCEDGIRMQVDLRFATYDDRIAGAAPATLFAINLDRIILGFQLPEGSMSDDPAALLNVDAAWDEHRLSGVIYAPYDTATTAAGTVAEFAPELLR
jgi:hypothetical protein